jgi:hypothetical protein
MLFFLLFVMVEEFQFISLHLGEREDFPLL